MSEDEFVFHPKFAERKLADLNELGFNTTRVVPISYKRNRSRHPYAISVYINSKHYAVFETQKDAEEAIWLWKKNWPAVKTAIFSLSQ